ncbi:MAG: type I-C CRISPR-associated protein Cas8c/Csd1, partial [Thermodesulfobacteriota bacterium]
MILQSLCTLYDRLEGDSDYQIAPPGYSLQKVSFRVVLSPAGELFQIQDVRQPEGKTLRPQLILLPGGAKPPSSRENPNFLWDRTDYLLGYKLEDKDPDRTVRCFEAFRNKHLALEAEIGTPAFSAVCRFLEGWEPARAADHPVLEGITTGFGVFRIQGQESYVHQDPKVRDWWRRQTEAQEKCKESEVGQCLITGNTGPLARLHPKIKNVRDAQGAGATIVSFNHQSYESYGKSQSLNAPVSEEAASRYGLALNALLDGPMSYKHRFNIGDATVAFWTDKPSPVEDVFAQFAIKGSEFAESGDTQDQALLQRLKVFLGALRKGREAYGDLGSDPDATRFCLLGLTGQAGGRIGVRFFLQDTLGNLLENLRAHFRAIAIEGQPATDRRRADPEFPSFWALLIQSAREPKDVPPVLEGPLFRSILAGAPYPPGLFSAVVRRIHADREVNYLRACVLKGYLNRNLGKEVPMSLDFKRNDPPYRLGRLFAA